METTVHPTTGRPISEVPTFAVGDLVTEHVGSDGYPAVVVHATPKTVYVSRVSYVTAAQANDIPGYNGYGDSATIAVDPESVEEAIAQGKEGATKYVLYVNPRPQSGNYHDEQRYGGTFHSAGFRRPGSRWTYLSHGARFRRDPHI